MARCYKKRSKLKKKQKKIWPYKNDILSLQNVLRIDIYFKFNRLKSKINFLLMAFCCYGWIVRHTVRDVDTQNAVIAQNEAKYVILANLAIESCIVEYIITDKPEAFFIQDKYSRK